MGDSPETSEEVSYKESPSLHREHPYNTDRKLVKVGMVRDSPVMSQMAMRNMILETKEKVILYIKQQRAWLNCVHVLVFCWWSHCEWMKLTIWLKTFLSEVTFLESLDKNERREKWFESTIVHQKGNRNGKLGKFSAYPYWKKSENIFKREQRCD